ncbi:Tubulin-folding cofactor C [Forsythia ovata]|uniref:Tubulin-folding cofactor C n=1 Tax=Forsythia ovata TaxID=205694 RepID=A0ABD1WNV2_9LAMI
MLERLSNRHHSRLAGKSVLDSTILNAPPSFESTQSFLSKFSQSKVYIESCLSQIHQQQENQIPDSDSNPKTDIEKISLSISDLEKLVAENSYFLPSYEVRTCLKNIADLKQSLDDVTSLVIPKKKFSFKNKPSKKPTNPVHNDAVSENNQNAGPDKLRFKHLSVLPGFRDKENEVLVKEFDKSDTHGQNGEFTLSGLRNCEVRLKGCLRALFMDRLINCRIYVGAVMGSVLIEGAEGCFFILASHQIRIHNAKNCDFYLRVRSRPIIEDCNGVRFAPYCLSYEGIEKDLEEANLGEETGNWANVDDFRWLRAVQSPNWSVLPDNERIQTVDILNSRVTD